MEKAITVLALLEDMANHLENVSESNAKTAENYGKVASTVLEVLEKAKEVRNHKDD